jgi:hypothetical protein
VHSGGEPVRRREHRRPLAPNRQDAYAKAQVAARRPPDAQPLHVGVIYLDAAGREVNPDIGAFDKNSETAGGKTEKSAAA